ncbi:MAG: UDP-N-acetylmuramate:L-alanyl-gamma-D-glutamyl-meso-diaminopimelate ligase, partial [Zwartia sp.]|nr:UDP-N-acetylmuramate:L-alanyl-gamma-D-glutamyl-meso-diaminopimelate ligase [Zwartia sp.]
FCFVQREGKQALGWDPAQILVSLGTRMQAHHDTETLVQAVAQAAQPGDHIVVMSNGGFADVHRRILDALAASHA